MDKYNSYAVIGLQFGNEGKRKIIDRIYKDADYIVRATGGNNASNFITLNNETIKLDIIPFNCANKNTKYILGPGTFINIQDLLEEIYLLENAGINLNNLYIDYRANIIMPYHILIDNAKEKALGKTFYKSTNKGISSAYSDKVEKKSIRFIDLMNEERLFTKLSYILKEKNDLLKKYDENEINLEDLFSLYKEYSNKLKNKIVDSLIDLNKTIYDNKKIIFESSQSTMLDIDYGSYPDVSSTNSTFSGICNGAGVNPKIVNNVVGIFKAYTTKRSNGMFPTEVFDDEKKHLVEKGVEYQKDTNVARRCGWLDLSMLKYSVELNGINMLTLTKLDVLTGLKKIKLAVAYEIDKVVYESFPLLLDNIINYEILYKEFDGWDENISLITKYEQLPENCKRYIEYIEGYLGVEISLISVGKNSDNIIKK